MRVQIKFLSLLMLLAVVAIPVNAGAGLQEAGRTDYGDEFVDVKEIAPSIQLDIRYFSNNNFVGTRVDGYTVPKCILTRAAALALRDVQQSLADNQQSLKVFDCYRPQRAVDHFVRWAKDLNDQKMKSEYYPSVDKRNLFKDGYIAEKSGHSRGGTVDLTIIDLKNKRELDMGSPFDFFDPISHTDSHHVNTVQHQNRYTLKSVMERNGFKNLEEEWWHYTLRHEIYPDRYFDFKIE